MKLATLALALLVAFPTLRSAQTQKLPDETPVLWAGDPKADQPEWFKAIMALPASELRAELARIQLRQRTTRNFDSAKAELMGLRTRAAKSEGFDPEVSLAIMRARVELGQALGDLEGALQAAKAPVPSLHELKLSLVLKEVVALGNEQQAALQQGSSSVAQALSKGIEDKQMNAGQDQAGNWLIERLNPEQIAYLRSTCGTPGANMTKFIERALWKGHGFLIGELGIQAAPALTLLILEDLAFENEDDFEYDPLKFLIDVDEGSASQLAFDWLERGGPAWRLRVLHWMSESEALRTSKSWFGVAPHSAVQNARPRHNAWIQIIEQLLLDPRLQNQALAATGLVARWDALTPVLQERLAKIILFNDADDSQRVLEALSDPYNIESARPIYLAGLKSIHGEIRRQCAELLFDSKDAASGLRGLAADPDPVLRALAAGSMVPHFIVLPYLSAGIRPSGKRFEWQSSFGAQEFALVEQLMGDPDADVREAAFEALRSRSGAYGTLALEMAHSKHSLIRRRLAAFTESWFRSESKESDVILTRLLNDASASVRAGLVEADYDDLPPSVELRVFAALAQDQDPMVLEAVDEVLERGLQSADVFNRVIPLRVGNQSAAFAPHGGGEQGWLKFLQKRSEAGAGTHDSIMILGIGLQAKMDQLIAKCLAMAQSHGRSYIEVLAGLDTQRRMDLYDWCSSPMGKRDVLVRRALDKNLVQDAEVCRAVLSGKRSVPGWFWGLAREGIHRGDTELARLCLAFFGDLSRSVSDRMRAGTLADVLGTEEDRKLLMDMLKGLGGSELNSDLKPFVKSLEGSSHRNAFLLQAAKEPLLDDSILAILATAFDREDPDPVATAVSLLERWVSSSNRNWFDGCMEGPILSLASAKQVETHAELLLEVARLGGYGREVVGVVIGSTDPRFLEMLGAEFNSGNSWSKVQSIVQALLPYGSPEAAQMLRKGLLRATQENRELIIEALNSLELYWGLDRTLANRAIGTREDALAELAGMLADKDPMLRAEAARSLAAFGSLESLPKLIPLLKDAEESVRTAAKEAIELLRKPAVTEKAG